MMDHLSPVKYSVLNNFDQSFTDATSPAGATAKFSPNLSSPMNIGKLSHSMQDARESLGILPPDFEKDLNLLNITVDKDTLSLNTIFNLEESDIGRESLGILQLNNLDVNFGNESEKVPDIMLSIIGSVDSSAARLLDTAFLLSSPRGLQSISQNSILSFNSNSLEYPSKIFTLNKDEFSSSVFSPSNSLLNNAKIGSLSNLDYRSRIKSQPLPDTNNDIEANFFWSTGKTSKTKILPTNHICGKLDFDDKDAMFHDSLFIEGNYIAQKIADGSFLNDPFEHGPLDCTPQPEWPNELDETESKNSETPDSRTDTDAVFKAVDKLLPNAGQINSELSIKTSRSSSASSKSRDDAKEILQNLSEIFNTTHKSDQQKSQGRMLLNNLAEMLNNTPSGKDDELEDSGHSSITGNESDKDKRDPDEVENLNKKVSGSLNVDPSVNSESTDTTSKRRLSQSLCPVKKLPQKLERRHSSTMAINASSNKIRNNSTSSIKSTDSNGSTFGAKIKPKIGNVGIKKGPLRAVIPVKEMKKGASTPDKIEQKISSTQLQSTKTSTPINEPRLKPVASSTPTLPKEVDEKGKGSPKWSSRKSTLLNRSNSLPENKISVSKDPRSTPTTPTSKLRGPSFSGSFSKEKGHNTSSSIPSRFQEIHKPIRRNSVTEGVLDHQGRTKRSNSLGKETGMMSSLRKIRENMIKSPYYNHKTGVLVDSNVKVGSDEERRVTFRKSLNSSVKLKKKEKENVY